MPFELPMLELLRCREPLFLELEDFLLCLPTTLALRLESIPFPPFFRRGGASSAAMQTSVGEGVRDTVTTVFSSKDGLVGSREGRRNGRLKDESFRGDMLFGGDESSKRYVQLENN
jgi:hypothetical protein